MGFSGVGRPGFGLRGRDLNPMFLLSTEGIPQSCAGEGEGLRNCFLIKFKYHIGFKGYSEDLALDCEAGETEHVANFDIGVCGEVLEEGVEGIHVIGYREDMDMITVGKFIRKQASSTCPYSWGLTIHHCEEILVEAVVVIKFGVE